MWEILLITIVGGIIAGLSAGVVIVFVQFFLNRWLAKRIRLKKEKGIFNTLNEAEKER